MKTSIACLLLAAASAFLAAQEADFGFGFDNESAAGGNAGTLAVSVGGEVGVSLLGFVEDLADGADHTRLGDLFSGKLKFSAETSLAEGIVNLKLAPGPAYYGGTSPVYVEEAYVRAFFGALDIEGGLRKLSWGRRTAWDPWTW